MRAVVRLVIAALAALASAPFPAPAPDALAAVVVPAAAAAGPARVSLLRYDAYRVRPGDTLTGIAQRLCGRAIDWTGFYAANRQVIGGSPDLIVPGQVLRIACWDPPVRAATAAAHRAADGDGDRPGGTYGHPYTCGDGDRDGWDLPCGTAGGGTYSAVRPAAIRSAAYGTVLSYGQLEQLWISAGGPSWAAAHAASIAECESGGNVYAHNPSGASGIFQILGQVVPGNIFNPLVNALNAVAKFRASGDTFAQWVCT